MLRVGLTGGLGSGKSTVASMLAALGAVVVSADEIGRALMEPGQPVFAAIVARFGEGVQSSTGELDRLALSRLAFNGGRIEELNAIVHPAVIARQEAIAAEAAKWLTDGVFVVESALLFQTAHGGEGGWRKRFDRVVLVVAPEELRVERFVARTLRAGSPAKGEREVARAEARKRMTRQLPESETRALADYVVRNVGTREALRVEIEALWPRLLEAACGAGR